MARRTRAYSSLFVMVLGAGVAAPDGAQALPATVDPPRAAPGPLCDPPCRAGTMPHAPHAGIPWRRADQDRDGALTRAELEAFERAQQARRARQFEAADRDHDGRITRAERRALHAAPQEPEARGPGRPRP